MITYTAFLYRAKPETWKISWCCQPTGQNGVLPGEYKSEKAANRQVAALCAMQEARVPL